MTLNVTIWNEFRHEKTNEDARKVYPDGLHGPIADHLRSEGMTVRAATLDEPEHGLTDAVLAETDVLTWWGHMAHYDVSDEIVDRVQKRVLDGMGLIVLHSGHHSKIFKRLMGTTCDIIWRQANERERIWVDEPGESEVVLQVHPDAASLEQHLAMLGDTVRSTMEFAELETLEVYGTPSDELRAMFERLAPQVRVTIRPVHWGGFTRPAPASA